MNLQNYEDSSYRQKLLKGEEVKSFYNEQYIRQIFTLKTFWPQFIRNKNVMNVGSVGSSLLDYLKGPTSNQIEVEPYKNHHESFKKRGYKVFSSLEDVQQQWSGQVDFAFAIQVIEHTLNPKSFIIQLKK